MNAYDYLYKLPGRPWNQFLTFYDRISRHEGSAVFEAQLHDPDVMEEMAAIDRPQASPPSWYGYTREYAALVGIQDQLIAMRGGKHFTPKPKVPGFELRWKRKDSKLHSTIARLTGED